MSCPWNDFSSRFSRVSWLVISEMFPSFRVSWRIRYASSRFSPPRWFLTVKCRLQILKSEYLLLIRIRNSYHINRISKKSQYFLSLFEFKLDLRDWIYIYRRGIWIRNFKLFKKKLSIQLGALSVTAWFVVSWTGFVAVVVVVVVVAAADVVKGLVTVVVVVFLLEVEVLEVSGG